MRPTQRDPGWRTRHQHALVSPNTITRHPSGFSTPVSAYRSIVSCLFISEKPLLNVFIFGETRVGKSSIVNLIVGKSVADTSPDAPRSMLKHNPYELNFGDRYFRFWEVPSIASMGFLRRTRAKWQLKKSYKNLHKGEGVYLLLYCMRGPSAPSALPKDYKYFTSIVSSTSHVPIALVVNGLEGSPNTMDDWWTKNKRDLERVGMHFSKHVCITSLPDNPSTSRSRQAVRSLICDGQNL
jgi:predicted GTPase